MRALLIEQCCAVWFAVLATVTRVVGYLPHARGSDPPRRPAPIDGGWMGVSSVLAGEPRHPRSNVAHYRLESRISTLPEVHEATVVLARLGAVAAAFVKLPQPPQARRESTPEVVDVLGRSCVGRHLLVGGQRGIGLPGLLVSQPQFPVAARVARAACIKRSAPAESCRSTAYPKASKLLAKTDPPGSPRCSSTAANW